jgi:RHS repeat-associated protein
MRRISKIFFLLLLFAGVRLHAACGTPSISISYSGPDEQGQGTLSMTYDLAGASSGHLQVFSWDSETYIRSIYTVSAPSGTVTVGLSTSCLSTGPHLLKAAARNCTGSDDPKYRGYDRTTVSVNTTPTLSLSATKRADGDFDVAVTHHFPNTASWGSRFVKLYKNGSDWLYFRPSNVSGTTVFKTGAFCGEVTGTAVACERHGDPRYIAYASAQLPADACKEDRGQCEAPGKPVNVGSGDVTVDIPMFTLDDPVLPLGFALSYHSRPPVYRSLTPEMGYGWHHPFGESLRVVNDGAELYRTRSDGQQVFYARDTSVRWSAVRPAAVGETVTLVGAEYHVEERSGTVTVFDAATGRWLRTADERGNVITAQYTDGNLSAVTDARGRTVTVVADGPDLQQLTLPGGATWRFAYTNGNLSAIFDPMHTGATPWRTFTYKSLSGQPRLLTAMYDEAGKLLEGHAYDSSGRATTSYAEGNAELVTLQYDYPSAGTTRVTHTIDAATKQVSDIALQYVPGRFLPIRLTGRCSTCGGTSDNETREYDAAGRLVRRTDGRGAVSSIVYDAAGNVGAQTVAEGTPLAQTTQFEYGDPRDPGRVTSIIEGSVTGTGSRISTEVLDATESIVTRSVSGRIDADDETPTVIATVDVHDARGRLLTTDGPRADVADVTTQAYYADDDEQPLRRGRLRSITDAAGHTTTFDDYDVYGTARRAIDPNGVVTELVTDAAGRVTQRISRAVDGDPAEAADLVETTVWDGRDRQVEIVRPNGNRIRHAYQDGTNFLADTIVVDGNGNEVERLHRTRNTFGSIVLQERQRCTTPAPVCTGWTTTHQQQASYDSFNRVRELIHADGSRRVFAYDGGGAVVAITDEAHTVPNTRHEYDLLGRLIASTQTLGSQSLVTRQSYDAHDNLTGVTDPNGNVTTYRYDDFRRLVQESSPVSGTTTAGYDAAGNVVVNTDANGASTTRTFDALGRVLEQVSRRSGVPDESSVYVYDTAAAGNYGTGRLASVTAPSGTTSYRYDRRGHVREQTRGIHGSAYTLTYRHDGNGNLSAIGYPSGRQVTYGFDAADRPRSVAADGTPLVQSVSYFPFGPSTRIELANGTTQTQTFDSRYRMVTNRLESAAGAIADYAYTYDKAGQVTSIRDLTDAAFDRTFAYDGLGRLVTANSGPGLWGSGSYSYDSLGNVTAAALGATSRTFTYAGTTAKLATASENGVTRSIVHDAAGNEVTAGSLAYHYSARNRLAATDDTAYDYDSQGIRVSAAQDGLERHYLYSRDFALLAETASTGSAVKPIEHEYIWLSGSPIAQVDVATGAIAFTFADHLGTPILQSNAAGEVLWRAEYEPYGAVWTLRAGAGRHQPLRFAGQEVREGDLSYNVFRWYRAGSGRYTQADPIGLTGGIHPYLYAGANPLSMIDPLGLTRAAKNMNCCELLKAILNAGEKMTGWLWEEREIQRDARDGSIYRTLDLHRAEHKKHKKNYEGHRKRLQKLLDEYKRKRCPPGMFDPKYHELRDHPYPPINYEEVWDWYWDMTRENLDALSDYISDQQRAARRRRGQCRGCGIIVPPPPPWWFYFLIG